MNAMRVLPAHRLKQKQKIGVCIRSTLVIAKSEARIEGRCTKGDISMARDENDINLISFVHAGLAIKSLIVKEFREIDCASTTHPKPLHRSMQDGRKVMPRACERYPSQARSWVLVLE